MTVESVGRDKALYAEKRRYKLSREFNFFCHLLRGRHRIFDCFWLYNNPVLSTYSGSVTSLPVAYISLCSVFTFHFISVFYLQLNFKMHLFELSAFENQEAHSEEDFRFEKSLKVSLFNRISISLFSSYVLNVKILGGCRNSKICGLSFIMLLITVKQHSCRSRRKKSELLLHRWNKNFLAYCMFIVNVWNCVVVCKFAVFWKTQKSTYAGLWWLLLTIWGASLLSLNTAFLIPMILLRQSFESVLLNKWVYIFNLADN